MGWDLIYSIRLSAKLLIFNKNFEKKYGFLKSNIISVLKINITVDNPQGYAEKTRQFKAQIFRQKSLNVTWEGIELTWKHASG